MTDYEITNVSIISPTSGEWEVSDYGEAPSHMKWEATHPDYDGAEDGCTTVQYAASLEDLLQEVKFYDSEQESSDE